METPVNKMQHSKTNLQNVPGGCPGCHVVVLRANLCRPLNPGGGFPRDLPCLEVALFLGIGVLASRFGTGSLEHSLPSAFCYSFAFWMDLNCNEETITESEDFAATCWGENSLPQVFRTKDVISFRGGRNGR
uniref:Uncharacterized protein n=1 Tax=Anopheles arabiensis TaxID=7173 RepID=A0A8W7MT46_ANOAR